MFGLFCMIVIEFVGWLGAILLATCGLPQFFKTIKTKKFDGLSIVFLIWWLIGEILTLFYVIWAAWKWPLLFNYTLNILLIFIMLFIYAIYEVSKK